MSGNICQIFFDLGGVVVSLRDGFGKLARAIDRPQMDVVAAYAKHVVPAERGQISTPEFWHRFRAELALPENNAIQDYEDYWTDCFAPIPETHDLLRELVSTYKIGIITNTEFGVVERAFQKGHVPNLPYSVVIKSCDVGFAKPEPEIFRLAQDKVNVKSHAILFVDDKAANIRAAEMLGWRGVLFDEQRIAQSIEEIRANLR